MFSAFVNRYFHQFHQNAESEVGTAGRNAIANQLRGAGVRNGRRD